MPKREEIEKHLFRSLLVDMVMSGVPIEVAETLAGYNKISKKKVLEHWNEYVKKSKKLNTNWSWL